LSAISDKSYSVNFCPTFSGLPASSLCGEWAEPSFLYLFIIPCGFLLSIENNFLFKNKNFLGLKIGREA
jgi:hypothetical protein